MTLQIIDCEQRSPEWYAARLGLATASNFQTIMVPIGPKGGVPLGRKTLLRTLAGEIITGEPAESYTNAAMDRGRIMEDEARDFYSFMNDVECQRVGFVRNGRAGCSPDSFVGTNRMLEIKTAQPNVLIEILEKDEFPNEHKAQCQGGLWVCQKDVIDLSVYWPKMPPFIKEAGRDEVYIAKLASEVARFNDELDALVDRIRRYGGERAAA